MTLLARRDRALRRVVADLATQPAIDIDAVLEALPEDYSRRIAALMVGFNGAASTDGIAGLSSRLSERIEAGSGMTPHAAQMLRECAREAQVPSASQVEARTPCLLCRLFGFARGTAR